MKDLIKLFLFNGAAVFVLVSLLIDKLFYSGLLHLSVLLLFVIAWFVRANELVFDKVYLRRLSIPVVSLLVLIIFLGIFNDIFSLFPKESAIEILMRIFFILLFFLVLAHGVAALVRRFMSYREEN